MQGHSGHLGHENPAGAQCHAVRVRPDGPAEVAALTAHLTANPSVRLWVEDIPLPSTDAKADRRRLLELTRPADGLRAVLLRWTDGEADLILVSPRSLFDRTALLSLAAGADPGPPTGPTPDTTVAVTGTGPEWGLGKEDAGPPATLLTSLGSLNDLGDARSWLTALAVTLRRYDPDQEPVIGTPSGALTAPGDGTLGAAELKPISGSATVGLLFDTTRETGAGKVPITGEYLPCLAPPFPLTVSVFLDGQGPQLRCDHLPGRIAPEIARQFVRHLIHVHRQVRNTPETPVGETELLDEAELARIVALGRPRAELVSVPTTLHAAFRAVAAAHPDVCAVRDGRTQLTYRELDERSDRLAAGLRAHGVRDGDRVGVCLERSAELVATLLGVVKAGAAYVPTDPAYPAQRLTHTVRDARLGVVITELAQFPGSPGTELLTPGALVAAGTAGAPDSSVGGDDPAYIIYTSGSSGRPKGVVVPHRNPIALMDATRSEYGLGAGDVWTFFHSGAFDFSVWEIWGALLTGGRLIVVPYDVSREPSQFRDLLVAEGVTVLSQTPSAFAQLLDVDHTALTVRLVVFGGEPLDAPMLLPWFDRHPESRCRVVNMFGITETTVHVTAQTITRRLALAATRSVGPALPGWHLYVRDPAGRTVPPGVAGEICVGGAGVALGYFGQEDLTAQRFRPDPYGEGRLYLSGDRGRLRPDGSLEHLGRLDSQVKIRGFRIELDEIRSVLLEDPDVRAAAVVARRGDPADAASARIDAYVVLADAASPGTGGVTGTSIDTSVVRKRAASVLPAYMVPATVTSLPALPLTTNGKLDQARLPEPAIAPSALPAAEPGTGDELTAAIVGVWSKVLGVPVGVNDDFFELGGNSLYAIRISSAMRANGLPTLRLRQLYSTPTVAEVVQLLRSA
ncbi:amino acid adenylation domain-containing protein [Streptomyces sp. NPDC006012]|uniref:non-ribosomal peptide synthetase n=1 Tax=Streptomyces sp. NPDC006012 TaxID=3364739 RepID=UPI0036A110A6